VLPGQPLPPTASPMQTTHGRPVWAVLTLRASPPRRTTLNAAAVGGGLSDLAALSAWPALALCILPPSRLPFHASPLTPEFLHAHADPVALG